MIFLPKWLPVIYAALVIYLGYGIYSMAAEIDQNYRASYLPSPESAHREIFPGIPRESAGKQVPGSPGDAR